MANKGSTENEEKYLERVRSLTNALYDPRSNVNFDFLFDCFNSIIYELNGKSSNKSKNILGILSRLKETSDLVTKSRINLADFTTLKVLGKGAFGEVCLVRHKETNKVYALKSMNKTEMVKRDEALCLWEEREIMALSNSDWLVRMYYSFQDPVNIYMVMEFVQGGDMVNFMSSYDVDEDMAKFYLAEVCLGLDFLHSIGFIHRDMKPDNMLLDHRGHLKICDFGTCIRMDKDGKVKCSIAVGTPDYISPEVLNSQNNNTPYGKEVDWWSVGIFLYEFLCGDTPFYSKSLIGTYNKILNYRKHLTFPEDVDISSEAQAMIKGFLTDSSNRFGNKGIPEIAAQPFFKDVPWSWDNIRNSTAPILPDLAGETDASCFENNQEQNDLIVPLPQSSQLACDHFPFIGFSFSGEYIFNNLKAPGVSATDSAIKRRSNAGELLSADNSKRESKIESKMADLKKIITEKDNLYNNLLKNLESKELELKKFDGKIDELDKVRREFEVENCVLKSKINDLESQIQGYAQEIKKMEVQIKFTKIAEAEAKKRHGELLDQSQPLKELNELLKREKRELEIRLTSAESELEVAKASLDETDKNFKAIKSSYQTLRNEVDQMKIAFKCESLEQLRTYVENIQIAKTEIAQKLENSETKIKSYEELLKKESINQGSQMQMGVKLKILADEKQALQKAFENLSSEHKELLNKNSHLSQSLRTSEEENSSLSDRLRELSHKVLTTAQNETKILREKNDLLMAKGELESRLEKSLNLLKSFEVKINAFDEQFSYFELKMAVQVKKIEVLESTMKAREGTTSELNTKISQLNEANKESSIILEMKNKEIAALQSKMLQLEAQISVQSASASEEPSRKSSIEKTLDTNRGGADSAEVEQLRTELAEVKRLMAEAQKKFDKTLETERLLKEESIKKLNQVLSMPGMGKIGGGTVKTKSTTNAARSDRKVDQLYKQLQMDYFKLRDESTDAAKNYETKIIELNTVIMDLQATVESMKKEKIIEQTDSSQDPSKGLTASDGRDLASFANNQIIKQSFLFYPSKSAKSSRKINWTRCVVTLTNSTFTIYKDSEVNDNNIMHKIEIALLYYVRPICQNDLIRSLPSDIPKIFQVIYNDDTDASEAFMSEISADKCTIIGNHCLVNIQYHMPATCDVCGKGLWGFIKSSYAMECKNCHFKCHREHAQEPKSIPLCRDYENRRMAKEILLMACSPQEQKSWIDMLLGLMKLVTPQKGGKPMKKGSETNVASSQNLLDVPSVK